VIQKLLCLPFHFIIYCFHFPLIISGQTPTMASDGNTDIPSSSDKADKPSGNKFWSEIGAKAVAAGAFLSAKAKEIDEKHHIVDKTKSACSAVATKAKEVDEKHHIVDKTMSACSTAVTKTKEGIDSISKNLSKGGNDESKPK
jgi:hypothetical protein